MPKTATAQHLLPTNDLREQLNRVVGGLTIETKGRGLDWLFYDLDGKSIVGHYYPAQSLLNIHAEGSAKPTFQANGVAPDDIPGLLAKHLNGDDDEKDEVVRSLTDITSQETAGDLSERQRDMLFRVVLVLAGNPEHAKTDALQLVQRARDIVLHTTAMKAHDNTMD